MSDVSGFGIVQAEMGDTYDPSEDDRIIRVERQRIGEEINHHELDYEDDGYVLIARDRLRAILTGGRA